MKSPKKRTPAKKLKQPNVSDQDSTIDLGGYGAIPSYNSYGTDTITLDSSSWVTGASGSTMISNGGYTITGSTTAPYTFTTAGAGNSGQFLTTGSNGASWTTGTSVYQNDNNVHINADGLTMKEGADIKIGSKSLTKAIEQIEERLAILNPNPALEERWDKLKDLRKQYMEMEKDILEKEKIMKILKES
jgi:hypothetical protein